MKWQPIGDELEGSAVLITGCNGTKQICMTKYIVVGSTNFDYPTGGQGMSQVAAIMHSFGELIHWMPLPKPPIEEGES